MTLALPTNPEYYVMNNAGKLYHLVGINDEYVTSTLCGIAFEPDARVPVNTPQVMTSLLCKRCERSL